jgi:hypothetical protein
VTGQAGLLELSPGSVLRLDGVEWTVEAIEAQPGRVLLRAAGGERRWRTIRWLAHHRDCQRVPAEVVEAGAAGQPPTLGDLTEHQREVVRLRLAHLLEAETGFRGGDARDPAPGEPRLAYDPVDVAMLLRDVMMPLPLREGRAVALPELPRTGRAGGRCALRPAARPPRPAGMGPGRAQREPRTRGVGTGHQRGAGLPRDGAGRRSDMAGLRPGPGRGLRLGRQPAASCAGRRPWRGRLERARPAAGRGGLDVLAVKLDTLRVDLAVELENRGKPLTPADGQPAPAT